MMEKALIKFEENTYWLDITSGFPRVKIEDNGKWRPALKTEVDVFDLMETGEVISNTKPENLIND